MTTVIHKWVAECRTGENPRTVCRVASGWVVMGEAQFLPGYCLLLPDPVVPHLNYLNAAARAMVLQDVTMIGDAVLAVTGAIRCNYEILGNLEPALHVHIFPRFNDEPEALRTRPVWFYDWNSAPRFDAQKQKPLVDSLRKFIQEAGAREIAARATK